MLRERKFAENLLGFIDEGSSMFHVVEESRKILEENGFKELLLEDEWDIEKGGSYYTVKNGSALVAFTVGKEALEDYGFRIIGSHTDSPSFRVKPNPEIVSKDKYLTLNTEVYGGPILNTWFDRPLSIAGRVSLQSNNPFKPREELIRIERPIMTIPNLAIHMNREVNSGFKINPQEHTLPLSSMVNDSFERDGFLLRLMAEELKVDYKEILDFEVYLYAREKGELIGVNQEFISAGRLDDLAMVHAGLWALVESKPGKATNMLVAFDNEEVGSETKQGAGSPMLKNITQRIAMGLSNGEEDYLRSLESSFIISADMAHAVHPNFIGAADPTNMPVINEGPAIKLASNQAYTTDSNSSAVYKSICREAGIPVQVFVNRSDKRGGSTIGPISSSQLAIQSVDIGNPILAMHSVRELGGVMDHYYVYRSFLEYFSI